MPSDRELDILRHAIGHTTKGEPYRTHYVAERDSEAHRVCVGLMALGLMTSRTYPLADGMDTFLVTPQGIAAARRKT